MSESSSSEGDDSWIQWFCGLQGHEMFCEVERGYIEDSFNLYGLRHWVPSINDSLDVILDRVGHSDASSELMEATYALYGLIHARYVLTTSGLEAMYAKYTLQEFGNCPHFLCRGQPVVPLGVRDEPHMETVKLYCPKCQDIYVHPSHAAQGVDGAYFGTTFPHLFFMTYGNIIPGPPEQKFVPRVFGFRVHSSAAGGAFARSQHASQQQQQEYQERLRERRRLRAADALAAAATATTATAAALPVVRAATADGRGTEISRTASKSFSGTKLGSPREGGGNGGGGSGTAAAVARVMQGAADSRADVAGAGSGKAPGDSSVRRSDEQVDQEQCQTAALAAVGMQGVGAEDPATGQGMGVRVKVMGKWVDEDHHGDDNGYGAAAAGRREGTGEIAMAAPRDGDVQGVISGERRQTSREERERVGTPREKNGCSGSAELSAGDCGKDGTLEAGEASGAAAGCQGRGRNDVALLENGGAARKGEGCEKGSGPDYGQRASAAAIRGDGNRPGDGSGRLCERDASAAAALGPAEGQSNRHSRAGSTAAASGAISALDSGRGGGDGATLKGPASGAAEGNSEEQEGDRNTSIQARGAVEAAACDKVAENGDGSGNGIRRCGRPSSLSSGPAAATAAAIVVGSGGSSSSQDRGLKRTPSKDLETLDGIEDEAAGGSGTGACVGGRGQSSSRAGRGKVPRVIGTRQAVEQPRL